MHGKRHRYLISRRPKLRLEHCRFILSAFLALAGGKLLAKNSQSFHAKDCLQTVNVRVRAQFFLTSKLALASFQRFALLPGKPPRLLNVPSKPPCLPRPTPGNSKHPKKHCSSYAARYIQHHYYADKTVAYPMQQAYYPSFYKKEREKYYRLSYLLSSCYTIYQPYTRKK